MNKKVKVLASIVGLVLVSNGVVASESAHHDAEVKATIETKGDAAQGKNKAAACVACHGRMGNSNVAMYPKLAGQSEKYLIKQLNV